MTVNVFGRLYLKGSQMAHNDKILSVVDDELNVAHLVADIANDSGYVTEIFTRSTDFRQNHVRNADVIVLDLFMPNCDGVELLRYLAQSDYLGAIILMSGGDSGILESTRELALNQGLSVLGILQKPFKTSQLKDILEHRACVNRAKPSSKLVISRDELSQALLNRQLSLFYQPQVNLKNNKPKGVEALIRWQHPSYGMVSPDKFIPLAEQSGLIDLLTQYVIEQALTDMNQFRRLKKDLTMSINVSPKNLKDLSLPEKIISAMNELHLPPDKLIVEVTETAVCEDANMFMDILTRLRIKNINLAIDDFGTGYSSLLQMIKAPFNELKIDQYFIRQMLEQHECMSVVSMSLMLARELKMTSMAEGVENESIYKKLASIGCDCAQGYWIAKPMPFEQLLEWEHQWQC